VAEPGVQVREWPDKPEKVESMSERDIARYLVKGHAAYKSCRATLGEE
jgi:hypothetical protein